MPGVKIITQDPKTWRNIIEALSTLIDEAVFTFTAEGVKLRAMDPSRIAMVDLTLAKSYFEDYVCDAETHVGVNLNELGKIMKRAAGDKLEVEAVEGRLRVTFKGKVRRSFSIPLLDLGYEELPTPNISFNVEAKMLADAVKEALKDAELVSDYVKVEASINTLSFYASSDRGEASASFVKEEGALLDLNVKEPSKALYSLSYLSDMMKAAAASEIVTLRFSTDMPLSLAFEIPQGGKITYYLAPRLEG
ncbi:MAG: proliferating cell nuclear antigen (pcna) [Candidatus Nezhaarchaeales archaeon]